MHLPSDQLAECPELIALSPQAQQRVLQHDDQVAQLRQLVSELMAVHVQNMTLAGTCRARHNALSRTLRQIRDPP